MNNTASFGRSPWFKPNGEAPEINPRAIARGFDRYLAPHGIRTQAQHQGDGCLHLVVECQTLPERDRLVQFMLHRLKQLNLAAIAGVKIIARLTGQTDDLWDHSVSFMPPVPQPLATPTGTPRQMPPPPPPNPALANRPITPEEPVVSPGRELGAEAASPPPPDPFTNLAETLAAEAQAVKVSMKARANRYYRRWAPSKPEQRTSRRFADFVAGVERRWTEITRPQTDAVERVQGKIPSRRRTLTEVAQWLEPLALERGWQVRVGQLGGRILAVTVDCALIPQVPSEFTEFHQVITQAVCKRLWALNAPNIRGVRLGIREAGQDTLAWQQTIRLATPASRSPLTKLAHAFVGVGTLRDDPVWDRIVRSLVLGGTAIVPFVLALWLAQQVPNITNTEERSRSVTGNVATGERTEQVIPFRQPAALPLRDTFAQADQKRSPVVQTALEVVPVTPHAAVTPSDETVTLLFGGDVTLSNYFETKIKGDYGKTFAKMPEYAQADVSMVNLENPLTTANTRRPGKTFNFKAKPESVEALTSGGVDIVTLGNNHAMDYQGKGLSETMEHLEKAGIHAVGGGRNLKEARRPKIMEVKGKLIAYFGYYNAYWHAATDGAPGTNPRDMESIKADMEAVRDQVDWIVVNYHWGEENAHYPAGYQRDLAQFTIDHGADLIVGHHPHVLQGAEVYKGKAIVYSLGNFIFGGNSRRNYVTAALQVSLTGDQMKLDFLPLVVQDYQPEVLKGDRGTSIFNHLKHISRNFKEPLLSGTTLTIPKSPAQSLEAGGETAQGINETQPKSEGETAVVPPVVEEKSETAGTVVEEELAIAPDKPAKSEKAAVQTIKTQSEADPELAIAAQTGAFTQGARQGFRQAQTHLSQSQVELTSQWTQIQQAQAASAEPVNSLDGKVAQETQKRLGQTLARAKAQLERQQSIAIAAEIKAKEAQQSSRRKATPEDPFPLFSTEGFTSTSTSDRPTEQKAKEPRLPFELPQDPSFAILENESVGDRQNGPLRPLTKSGRSPLLPFIEGAIQRAEASFW